MVIVDPQNKNNTVEVILENKGDNIFRCTYKPVQEGPHTIHVTFAGQPIPSSPFKVHISEGKHLIVLVNVAVFPVVSINVLVILKERATIKNQNKTKKTIIYFVAHLKPPGAPKQLPPQKKKGAPPQNLGLCLLAHYNV